MKSRKPLVVPALAGIIPCHLKAVQQTAHVDLLHALGCTSDSAPFIYIETEMGCLQIMRGCVPHFSERFADVVKRLLFVFEVNRTGTIITF